MVELGCKSGVQGEFEKHTLADHMILIGAVVQIEQQMHLCLEDNFQPFQTTYVLKL